MLFWIVKQICKKWQNELPNPNRITYQKQQYFDLNLGNFFFASLNESHDQNSSEQMMAAEFMTMIDSRPPETIFEEIELENKYVKSRYQSQKNVLGPLE